MSETEHQLIIHKYMEDHKRGWQKAGCSCGEWETPLQQGVAAFDGANGKMYHTKWREHLPPDYQPRAGSWVDEDGYACTGQAHVEFFDESRVFLALETRMTPSALIVRGFHYSDVSSYLGSAEEAVFPIARVQAVRLYAWWDMSEMIEREMDRPNEADAEDTRLAAECDNE